MASCFALRYCRDRPIGSSAQARNVTETWDVFHFHLSKRTLSLGDRLINFDCPTNKNRSFLRPTPSPYSKNGKNVFKLLIMPKQQSSYFLHHHQGGINNNLRPPCSSIDPSICKVTNVAKVISMYICYHQMYLFMYYQHVIMYSII